MPFVAPSMICFFLLRLSIILVNSSFELYHDVDALQRLFNVHAVQWSEFVAYSARRARLGRTVTSQFVIVGHDDAPVSSIDSYVYFR